MDLYYRRVRQWVNGAWQVVVEGYVRGFGPNCTFEGPTYCSIAPPYLDEVWWKWSAGTYGTASSSWIFASEQKNY